MIISLLIVPCYLIIMLFVLIGFDVIFVKPNELDKQQEYIKANIEATKQAYGIDIDENNINSNETITAEAIKDNKEVIDNIALISKDVVLKSLNTMQTNKGYYIQYCPNCKLQYRWKTSIIICISKRNKKFFKYI